MNLIERASRRIKGLNPEKSVVEKAAERLQSPVGDGLDVPPPLHADGNSVVGVSRDGALAPAARRTQRQITVDLDRLRSMGMAPPGDESILGDEIRMIKRPLIDNAFSTAASRPENANLIMVTSAGPNDGKTFVASNLAMSMASEHGVRVLLVDADMAHPCIPKMFGFTASRGLIDVVEDPKIDLADVLIRTSIENLMLLPAGRHVALAHELLASPKMAQFVNDIAKRYADRIIIFDSPPLLARSEASILARHVGQVVFVIAAEHTSKAAVSDALRLVDERKYVGVVLNKTPSAFLREGFGQYNYKYKYYYNGGRAAVGRKG